MHGWNECTAIRILCSSMRDQNIKCVIIMYKMIGATMKNYTHTWFKIWDCEQGVLKKFGSFICIFVYGHFSYFIWTTLFKNCMYFHPSSTQMTWHRCNVYVKWGYLCWLTFSCTNPIILCCLVYQKRRYE